MYNLGYLGLYKNVPKKRMFNSTPNYERDSYSILQYKSHLRNEFLIPLKADGDGSGVATIYLQSVENQEIKITGAGRFYTDEQGTTGESTSAVVGTSLTTLYVKLNAGSCYLVLTKADKFLGLGSTVYNVITEATNAPFINYCAINYPLINLSIIRFDLTPNSNFIGSIDNTPNLTYLSFYRNLLSSFTGDIGKIVKCYYFVSHINTNCTFTYVTRRNDWTPSYAMLRTSCPSMTSNMVDNLLIDLDASGAIPVGIKYIGLDGLCGAATSASAAARASLVSKGFTIIVNT